MKSQPSLQLMPPAAPCSLFSRALEFCNNISNGVGIMHHYQRHLVSNGQVNRIAPKVA
jgi:hypothetical protein